MIVSLLVLESSPVYCTVVGVSPTVTVIVLSPVMTGGKLTTKITTTIILIKEAKAS